MPLLLGTGRRLVLKKDSFRFIIVVTICVPKHKDSGKAMLHFLERFLDLPFYDAFQRGLYKE